jgi:hypothetical protein
METENLKNKIIEIATKTILKKGYATLDDLYYEIVISSIEQGFSTQLFNEWTIASLCNLLKIFKLKK